jgi:hypothetical protein
MIGSRARASKIDGTNPAVIGASLRVENRWNEPSRDRPRRLRVENRWNEPSRDRPEGSCIANRPNEPSRDPGKWDRNALGGRSSRIAG